MVGCAPAQSTVQIRDFGFGYQPVCQPLGGGSVRFATAQIPHRGRCAMVQRFHETDHIAVKSKQVIPGRRKVGFARHCDEPGIH